MGNLRNRIKTSKVTRTAFLGATLIFFSLVWGLTNYFSGEEYILQGASRPALISAIQEQNGVVIHEFKIIQAVSARLTDDQVLGISSKHAMIRFFNESKQGKLAAQARESLFEDRTGNQYLANNSNISRQIGSDKLHFNGITGKGVAVAIIDSGLNELPTIQQNASGYDRKITMVNTMSNERNHLQDLNGHGSNIANVLADSSEVLDQFGAPTGAHNGVAPDVDLVMIKAFDNAGESSYASILEGIEYAIENKDTLNIRVLNLAFSFPATSVYWEDPINQALMRAWDSGITVVAAAGNDGNIGVPGNNPYVITVGAMDDNSTPFDVSDDRVAAFSSYGSTIKGLLKPELIAPGMRVKDLASNTSFSGTSQASAATAGVVALMIEQDPSLTPDEVKCRLMSTATQVKYSNIQSASSQLAQGAGLINAVAAINSTEVACANQGLNIFNDISKASRYLGNNVKEVDGVIWYDANKKTSGKEADGVIWYDANQKTSGKEVDGVIWYDANKKTSRKEVDGVIWYDANKKASRKEVDGEIWYDANQERTSRKEVDGVIWYDGNQEKTSRKDVDGVIWYDTNKKTSRKDVDGVIWYDANKKTPGKEVDGVIWYDANKKASRKDVDGAIWYDTIDVTDAKTAALKPLVISKSAQVRLNED